MKRTNDWIRAHLERSLGVGEPITAEQVRTHVATRRDATFEARRNACLAMGYVRYESVLGRAPNYLEYCTRVLADYRATGDRAYLVDLANFAELEYVTPSLPSTHYHAGDRDHEDK